MKHEQPTHLDYTNIYLPGDVASTYQNSEYCTTTDGWTGEIESIQGYDMSDTLLIARTSGTFIRPFVLIPLGETISRCPVIDDTTYNELKKIDISDVPQYSLMYVIQEYKGVKHVINIGSYLKCTDNSVIRLGHPQMRTIPWESRRGGSMSIYAPREQVISTGDFLKRDYLKEYENIQKSMFDQKKQTVARDIVRRQRNIEEYTQHINKEKAELKELKELEKMAVPRFTTVQDELDALLKNKRIEKARFKYGTFYIMTKPLQRVNIETDKPYTGRARMKNLGRLVFKITPIPGYNSLIEGNACGTIQAEYLLEPMAQRDPCHPHISSGVCTGNQQRAFIKTIEEGNLASAIDQLITGMTYIPQEGSPFFGYDTFLQSFVYDKDTDDYYSKKYYGN